MYPNRNRVYSSIAIVVSLFCLCHLAIAQGKSQVEWAAVQNILNSIRGVSTSPPTNIVTPKFTSGALMGNGDLGVVAGDVNPLQQTFYFGKSDFWGTHWNFSHNAPEVSILSFGSLTISSPDSKPGASSAEGYRMEQDILRAQVTSTMRMGGRSVEMRSWTSDDENIFVTEIRLARTNREPPDKSLPVTLQLAMPAQDAAPRTILPAAAGREGGVIWVSRENDLTAADSYKARGAIALRVLGTRIDKVSLGTTTATSTFLLRSDHPVRIVLDFESDSRIGLTGPSMRSLASKASARVARISASDIDALERSHRAWWKQFWLRSFVELSDKVLTDYYYGSLYVLGSSSRPGKLPPSLWGNFITTDNAGWGGRYFMNYNEEAPYYGVFSSNHADLAVPYNRMVLAQIPWQKNKTARAGYLGVSFQRTFSPFTVIAQSPDLAPVAGNKDYTKLPSDQKSNATFSFLPTIQYYEYTGDVEFLRSQLYPALRELDAFWRDFAVRDIDGKHWIFEHSSAHEGGDDVNPNLDLGFAHRVESELIATSEVLKLDAALRPVWQGFSDQLAPYPQGNVQGKPVFYEAASVKGDSSQSRLFVPGDQPINLEGLVFPGENLAIGGDDLQLETARNSLREMNSWAVTKGGNSHNGFCKIFPIAARIGWPAEDLIAKLRAAILFQWRPSNLTVFQGGGGIETAGSIEAIDSMLLQHENGVLRVFPDWPASRDASFMRLRAKGAFLVSSALRGGHVAFVDIVSENGGALVLENPWATHSVHIAAISEKPIANGKTVTIQTVKGGHYRLTSTHE